MTLSAKGAIVVAGSGASGVFMDATVVDRVRPGMRDL